MGGMGEVHLAALERTGGFEKQVAIKTILPRLMKDDKFVDLFEREARLAALLSHRNIVQIFDFGRGDQSAWLAMEYIHGVDLRVVLVSGIKMPVDLVVEVGMNCARALDYAHRAKDPRGRPLHIIHRDVSPQNILLSYEGDIKLADFGLALASAHGRDEDESLKGKFAYMSPEQATSQDLDERTDQFSLAVVLYELFSGVRAFHLEDGPAAVLRRVSRGRPTHPLRDVAPHLPTPLVDVIERAMAPSRKDRYVDTGAFGRALRAAALTGQIELGRTNSGAWLKTHFPEVTPSRASDEQSEATEVADEPINVGPFEVKTLALADTEIGLDQASKQVQILSHAGTDSERVQTPSQGRIDADPSASTLVPSMSGAPETDTQNVRLGFGFLGVLILGGAFLWMSDGSRPSPAVQKDSPSEASKAPAVSEALAPVGEAQALVMGHSEMHSPTEVTPTRQTRPPSSHTVAGQDTGVDTPTDASIVVDRAVPSEGPSKTMAARVRRRRSKPVTKPSKMVKSQSSSPTITAQPKPVLPEKIAAIPAEKNADSTDTSLPKVPKSRPEKLETSPPKLTGPRLRIVSQKDIFRTTGSKLTEGWIALDARGLLLESRGGLSPQVKVRVFARGGRLSMAVKTSPHVSIAKNGASLGFSPRANIPLTRGRHTFVFGDPKTGSKTLKVELAE